MTALQACLAVITLGLILCIYHLNTATIHSAMLAVQESGSPADALALIRGVDVARGTRLLLGIVGALLAFVTFGYLISVVALHPARQALKAQKRFIRNIAHELRTPLSIIKTNSEIALLDPEIEENAKRVVGSNIEELDRVSNIINNMLTLSALSRPDRSNFSIVDLARIVRNVSGKYETLARACQVRTVLLPCSVSYVWANASALDQIASNILRNALIYTPTGGSVGISVSPTLDGYAELKISDTGVGMSSADLERIFEPFYRADASRTRGRGGSGIGLTIVSELVRMHQGSIGVQSSIGEGTTVTVRFPLTARATQNTASAKQELGAVSLDFSDQVSGARG